MYPIKYHIENKSSFQNKDSYLWEVPQLHLAVTSSHHDSHNFQVTNTEISIKVLFIHQLMH